MFSLQAQEETRAELMEMGGSRRSQRGKKLQEMNEKVDAAGRAARLKVPKHVYEYVEDIPTVSCPTAMVIVLVSPETRSMGYKMLSLLLTEFPEYLQRPTVCSLQ